MRGSTRRTTTIAVLGSALSLLLGAPASADAPGKTGWWNAASAGGVALPQPTTGADDLHVSQGPAGPAAIAALSYDLLGLPVTGAVLALTVVPGSAVGTVDVVACPTKDAAWAAGGNQAWDTAPSYDCSKGARGIASADGTRLVFNLSTVQLLPSGGYSLAIVPAEAAAPFSVDVAKPDATSLSPELAAQPVEEPAPPAPAPPPDTSSGTAPLGSGTAAPPPAAGLEAPALPQAAPAPVAAAPPVAPSTQVIPARAAAPISNRDRYAAGTLLALLAGGLVWAIQQQPTQPRLIGGMARKAGGAPPAPVPVDSRPRGIGRFATLRTAPARRLV